MTDLLPCPFCGRPPRLAQTADGDYFYVKCPRCLARGPVDDTADEAAAAWNRRHVLQRRIQPDADPDEPKQAVMIRVPYDMHAAMKDAAADDGLSLNRWCVEAVRRALEDHNDLGPDVSGSTQTSD